MARRASVLKGLGAHRELDQLVDIPAHCPRRCKAAILRVDAHGQFVLQPEGAPAVRREPAGPA